MRVLIHSILILACAAVSGLAQPDTAETIPSAPPTFEENLGQANEGVRFVLRRAETPAFLRADRAVFGIGDKEGATWAEMRWIGGNPAARIEGLEKTAKKTMYMLGNDPDKWINSVESFDRVRYTEVYPGIDLDFYHRNGQMEYDFIVKPGADPRAIRLEFSGNAEIELTEDGAL